VDFGAANVTPTNEFMGDVKFTINGENCTVYMVVVPAVTPANYVYASIDGPFYLNGHYGQTIHFYSTTNILGKKANLTEVISTVIDKPTAETSSLIKTIEGSIGDYYITIDRDDVCDSSQTLSSPQALPGKYSKSIEIRNDDVTSTLYYKIDNFHFNVDNDVNQYYYINEPMSFDKTDPDSNN
jgi:hypothetical protein